MKLFFMTLLLIVHQPAIAEDYIVLTESEGVISRYKNLSTVNSSWTGLVPGFVINITQKEANSLKNVDGILTVERNGSISTDVDSWGLDRIDARQGLDKVYNPKATGLGVNIYILDTGIIEHEEFGDRIKECVSFIESETCEDKVSGHGTHVASTAAGYNYGVAPEANIHAYKVLSNTGSGSWSGIVRALNAIVSSKDEGAVSIVNMSLGGAGRSESIKRAVDAALASNILVVVAAGNSNRDACNYSPAFVPSAITVGSTTISDKRSSFSNYGSCLDTFAPGSSIKAAYNSSYTSYATLSGTSMASPHVAGAAALEVQLDGSLTANEIGKKLIALTTKEIVEDAKSKNDYLLFVGDTDDEYVNYFLAEKGESCQLACEKRGTEYDLDSILKANDKVKCMQVLEELNLKPKKDIKMIVKPEKMIGCAFRYNKKGKRRAIYSSEAPVSGAARKVWSRVCACK